MSDSRFLNLPANNWFRWETDFDLTTNAIVEVRLTNLAMGTTVTHNPFGRFLRGGNTLGALPSAFRLVAGGGGLSGNSLAFDNCAVAPRGPHALGSSYCSPCVVNSSGVSGAISATGSAVVAANSVSLRASRLPTNVFGYFCGSALRRSDSLTWVCPKCSGARLSTALALGHAQRLTHARANERGATT